MRCVLLLRSVPTSARAQELMAYVGAAFSSANADVRAAALRVAVVAAEVAGAVPVRRLLPQGMNPKMKEQVEQALGGEMMPTGELCWMLWRGPGNTTLHKDGSLC